MTASIEYQGGDVTQAGAVIEFFRQRPMKFIADADIRDVFGWPFGSVTNAVSDAHRFLTHDALYAIRWRKGAVYSPVHIPVNEKIYPAMLFPEPDWFPEFSHDPFMQTLIAYRLSATVTSDREALPLFSPDEYSFYSLVLHNFAERRAMTVPQISANLRFNQKKTSGIFTDIAPKIFNESGGTMILRKERRAGLCYILELNRP